MFPSSILPAILCNLGAKIDNIVARGVPHPDLDAPEDAESVRFWATSGGQASEIENTKVQAAAETHVQASGEFLGSLVSFGAMATDSGERSASGPTLRALVDVASAPPTTHDAPASRPKAKAKAKSRVSQQVPKTPAELRNGIRIFP